MWIDDSGVAHTIALPDPTDVMTDDFRCAPDALARADPESVQDVLGEAEEKVFDACPSELGTSQEYVGATPPVGLMQGKVSTAKDVAAAIEKTDLRWRLDAILALVDYLG